MNVVEKKERIEIEEKLVKRMLSKFRIFGCDRINFFSEWIELSFDSNHVIQNEK